MTNAAKPVNTEQCNVPIDHPPHDWYDGGYKVRCEGVAAVRQPVPERTLIGPPHAHLDAPCTDKCYETASAEPDPVAISNIRVGGAKVPIYADSVPTFHVDEIFPTQPQQADTSALLDLVRQYGDLRQGGYLAPDLFDRIAALVPPSAPDFLASINKLTIERDGERQARSEQFVELVKARGEREDALAEIDRMQGTTLGRGVVERDEARAEVEQLKAMLVEIAPDPSVLSLPQVPDGAKALIGEMGRIWEWKGGPTPWFCALLARYTDLAGVLAREGSVTVVMREPRTWPRLVAKEELADLPARIEVDGMRFRRSGDASYVHEHTGGIWAWWALRGRGDVTEVFEDEPGGGPR